MINWLLNKLWHACNSALVAINKPKVTMRLDIVRANGDKETIFVRNVKGV